MRRRDYIKKQKRRYKRIKRKRIVDTILIIFTLIIVGLGGTYYYIMKYNNKAEVSDNDLTINESNEDKGKGSAEEVIKREPVKKEIVISVAGDFTLGTDTKFTYESSLLAAFVNNGRNYSYFMKNVSNIFKEDDYTLVNLETTLTDSNIKAPKAGDVFYNFKGPKDYVNILNNASIDGVTIANNHIYDYGSKGIQDTIDTLKHNNVDICGEGYKILKDVKGIKLGLLGYTGWEFSNELKSKIVKDINELKSQGADIIIPYFHWGIEGAFKPDATQQNIAKFCIDNGADIIIGSHPHVIETIENYKGKLIAYSMGNFCFGGNSNPSDKRTFILQIKANIEDDKLVDFEYKVLPAMISSRSDKNDYIPTLADGDDKLNILNTLNQLSPTLDGTIKDEFFKLQAS